MTHTNRSIREIANVLIKNTMQLELPIDPEKIAEYLDIDVLHEDLEDEMSGFLVIKNGLASVAINRNHAPVRQRFTLAHEIGHFCLHVDKGTEEDIFVDRTRIFNRDKNASKGEDITEIEANKFAAKLLMPREVLEEVITKKYANEDLEDDEVIKRLASEFLVSTKALGYRLGNLGFVSKF